MRYTLSVTTLLFLLACAFAAERHGEFIDSAGAHHAWSINFARTLIWDNRPYIPVGVWMRITDPLDEARFETVRTSGITDVTLEAPVTFDTMPIEAWQAAVDQCEKRSLRYLLAMGFDPPAASGFRISPQSLRITGLTGAGAQTVRLPGADFAYFALVDRGDGSIVQSGRVAPADSVFRFDLKPHTDGEYVLLIYPHMPKGTIPDYWERYDAYRDQMLTSLKQLKFGPGFRGFVDPFGRRAAWYDANTDFVPDSPLFRAELQRTLQRTYATLDRLNVGWGTSETDLPSYEVAARLVPMYGRTRGAECLFDPDTGKLYKVTSKQSNVWRDIRAVLREISSRRATRLVAAIKHIVADAPIVFSWTGWSPQFEPQDAAPDGIGMHSFGRSYEVVENGAANALAGISDWSPAGWLLASELSSDSAGRTEYGNADALRSAIDWARSLGAKGFFFRVTLNKETLTWLATAAQSVTSDATLSNLFPAAVFFPESARTPAEIARLAGNVWWLPSNSAGERLDFGSKFDAYWISRPNGTYIYVWSHGETREITFKLLDPKNVKAFDIQGTALPVKIRKDSAKFDVGATPVLVTGMGDSPAPTEAEDETMDEFTRLMTASTKRHVDLSDLQTIFQQAHGLSERSPGAGYKRMRDALAAARSRLAPYAWIEAENSRNHNFGDTPDDKPASGGAVLRLTSAIDPPAGGYTARYEIIVPVEGDYALWMAGVPPGENGASPIEWGVDSNIISVVADAKGAGRYAGKYSWANLGSTRLSPGRHVITIRVRANSSGRFESTIDVLLLTPRPFVPNGLARPPVE